jgi:hypothetical protein
VGDLMDLVVLQKHCLRDVLCLDLVWVDVGLLEGVVFIFGVFLA